MKGDGRGGRRRHGRRPAGRSLAERPEEGGRQGSSAAPAPARRGAGVPGRRSGALLKKLASAPYMKMRCDFI